MKQLTKYVGVFAIIWLAFSCVAFGNIRYNHMNGEYEPAKSYEVIKYNHMNGEYSYEKPNSTIHYNHMNGTYYYQ